MKSKEDEKFSFKTALSHFDKCSDPNDKINIEIQAKEISELKSLSLFFSKHQLKKTTEITTDLNYSQPFKDFLTYIFHAKMIICVRYRDRENSPFLPMTSIQKFAIDLKNELDAFSKEDNYYRYMLGSDHSSDIKSSFPQEIDYFKNIEFKEQVRLFLDNQEKENYEDEEYNKENKGDPIHIEASFRFNHFRKSLDEIIFLSNEDIHPRDQSAQTDASISITGLFFMLLAMLKTII